MWKMAFKKLAQVEAVGLKRAAAVSECSKQHKYISSFEQHGLPLVMESVSFFFFAAAVGWFGLRFNCYHVLCSFQSNLF